MREMAGLLLVAISAGALAPPGLALRRTVGVTVGCTPLDVTEQLEQHLPPLEWACAHVDAGSERHLAVIDPALLEVAPAELVTPSASRRHELSVAVRMGRLMLPDGARLMLLPGAAGGTRAELELCVEASEGLLGSPPGASGAEAVAQAALRASLSAQGVAADAIEALEANPEPSAANRVYETFVGKPHRAEALMPAARRAAHHIRHLLRHEAAAADAHLRNVDDAALARARSGAPPHSVRLVLDNVRSAYNVGALFRTADTARCAEILTCGFTPHPPHPKLAKTGFGAVDSVPSRHVESTLHAVRSLQADGVAVYAMETTELSVNYAAVDFPRGEGGEGGVALVLGNEETGVDTAVLAAADGVIEVPTFGAKNSLNVAAAGAIVVFEALRQWGHLDADRADG